MQAQLRQILTRAAAGAEISRVRHSHLIDTILAPPCQAAAESRAFYSSLWSFGFGLGLETDELRGFLRNTQNVTVEPCGTSPLTLSSSTYRSTKSTKAA